MLYIFKVNRTPFIAKCVIDAQKMHKYLCSLVHTDRKSVNLLYKLDILHDLLYLQSDIRPDESPYLKLLYTEDMDAVLAKMHNEYEIHILVTTDTHMKKTVNGATKRVYVPSLKRPEWISEKLKRNGIESYIIKESAKRDVRFVHKSDRGGKASITIFDFDVYGKITDIDALRRAWHTGMGLHKAYGNGLFLLYR